MAALFDLHSRRGARDWAGVDEVDVAFGLICDHIAGLEPALALGRIRRYQAKLAALEATVVAEVNVRNGNDREAKRLLNDGKTSKRSIAKSARRGEVAVRNAGLIDKLAKGELSPEQLDVIADTSARTGGAAAVDEAFIGAVAGVNPDQAKAIADRFIADRADPEGVQSEHDRQHDQRSAQKYVASTTGLSTIRFEGDAVSIAQMWAAIAAGSQTLYESDGGRDLQFSKHPRTHVQRLFDAAHQLICGQHTGTAGTGTGAGTGGRPQVVVAITLDHLLGADRSAIAEQIGLGLIPDSVLADYLAHGDVIAALFDRHGQPLWLRRLRRHATLIQRLALVVRDKGCVLCGAEHQRCEVHHLTPWNAPAKGETNLDQLALLCGHCHHGLHDDNHTLYLDHRRRWQTRPATAAETPPTPTTPNNRPKRE